MASHDSILLRPGAASVDIHSVLITNRVGSIYILLFGSFVCLFFNVSPSSPPFAGSFCSEWCPTMVNTPFGYVCQGSYWKSDRCTAKLFGSMI